MRKLTLTHVLVLFLISVAMTVFAWPTSDEVRKSTGAVMGYNAATGQWQPIAVTGDGKLVTDAAVTVGSITVSAGSPADKNLTTIVSATASAQSVASLANRKSVSFVNQSGAVTGWVSLDSAVASAAVGIGIPLPPYGFFSTELDSSKIVGVAAGGVASITVYQDGY